MPKFFPCVSRVLRFDLSHKGFFLVRDGRVVIFGFARETARGTHQARRAFVIVRPVAFAHQHLVFDKHNTHLQFGQAARE